MSNRTPNTPPHGANAAPDALVQLYHDANAQALGTQGPGAAASERILAHARAQAAQRAAASADGAVPELPAAPSKLPTFSGEPANDRHWLRHALGGLAAIGLVGWLTLHHLDEPGAPQLDSPAPASAPQAAGTAASRQSEVAPATASAPAPVPAPAPASPPMAESAPVPAAAATAAVAAASANAGAAPQSKARGQAADTAHTEEKTAVARTQSAPAAIKSEATTSNRVAGQSAPADISATVQAEASSDKLRIQTAPAPAAAPAPAPMPAPPSAAASRQAELQANMDELNALSRGQKDAAPAVAMADQAASAEATAKPSAKASASPRAKAAAPAAKPLPYCDEAMPADAQAEQLRRHKARADAEAAGKPLPEPAPVCKPLPKKLSTPESATIDSR